MNPHNQTYKESLGELEEIVKAIQNGNIDVDELTQKVTRAAELISIVSVYNFKDSQSSKYQFITQHNYNPSEITKMPRKS